jgi:hypothetical protein
MTRDEQRQAWRVYAAAAIPRSDGAGFAAGWADAMMKEERKRFDQPDHSGDANKMVEPPAWVSAQFRPLDLSVTAPFVNTGQSPEPRPWVGLTDAERSEHIIKFVGGVLTTPKLYALLEKVEQQLKVKNGGTR